MARAAWMSKYVVPEPFGEADLEDEGQSLERSRCSYPPPDISQELTIDARLAAELGSGDDPHARKTEPDPHTRKTTPSALESPTKPERESAPHSIEDAVLRVLEGGGKRSIPKA